MQSSTAESYWETGYCVLHNRCILSSALEVPESLTRFSTEPCVIKAYTPSVSGGSYVIGEQRSGGSVLKRENSDNRAKVEAAAYE
jgi:starvation-inducible outer membrane lipoprotein